LVASAEITAVVLEVTAVMVEPDGIEGPPVMPKPTSALVKLASGALMSGLPATVLPSALVARHPIVVPGVGVVTDALALLAKTGASAAHSTKHPPATDRRAWPRRGADSCCKS
jgi:hypothetical protein